MEGKKCSLAMIQSLLKSIQALLANFPREILQQGQVRSNAPGQTYLVRRGFEYQHRARVRAGMYLTIQQDGGGTHQLID